MIKNTFIILSLIIITTQTHTMEVETEPCPLLLFPLDIQNIIASFLPFHDSESEPEFIERTKINKEIPQKDRLTHLPSFAFGTNVKTISVSCPNNKTFALLHAHLNQPDSLSLIFVDRHTNKKIKETHLDRPYISDIAISRNATMFATIYQEIDDDAMYSSTILSIKNDTSEKEETYDISNNFSTICNTTYPTIAFNKQGTHVILRGQATNLFYDHAYRLSTQNMKKNVSYRIFPLTTTLDQNPDNTKTLAKYFKQQGVCKNFTKQITSKK